MLGLMAVTFVSEEQAFISSFVLQSEVTCLRVLMATVLGLTAVIYGTEVWVERRIAVDSFVEPAGAKKKNKVLFLICCGLSSTYTHAQSNKAASTGECCLRSGNCPQRQVQSCRIFVNATRHRWHAQTSSA